MKAVVLLALASHAIFNRQEPSPWLIVCLYPAAWTVWSYQLNFSDGVLLPQTVLSAAVLSTVYTVTLLASIAVYRLFFHRLRHIPGPTSLKLSKWISVPMDIKGKRPERITAIHKQYGDVVRIGPREISINDPNAVSAILGGNSKCVKGPWYTTAHGGKPPRCLSLHVTIDMADRRARRRIWDQAFSVRALSGYEDELRKTTHAVMMQLEDQATKASKTSAPVSVDQWCMFYSFDIMGLLGFSRSFDMVEAGKFSNEAELLHGFMSTIMILANVPYMAEFARVLPNPLQQFEDYTAKALRERMQRKGDGQTGVPDIFAYLLDRDKESGWKHTWMELNADAGLIVVAGSDTSSSTLTMALHSLASNQKCYVRLREEIQGVFGKDVDPDLIVDFDALGKECPYLDAIINETLRLYPPVASGLQRETPANGDGVVVPLRDGKQIVLPRSTLVSIPPTTIFRDPRNFSPGPDEFRPERWIKPDDEEAFVRQAFIAFGYGPTGCVGRALAMMEMRIFLAQFVMRFDIELHQKFNSTQFLGGIRDTFTMSRDHNLLVKLTKRS